MKPALFLPLALAACVESGIPDSERADGVLSGTPIEVGGATLVAQQMTDWPQMAMVVTGDRGEPRSSRWARQIP